MTAIRSHRAKMLVTVASSTFVLVCIAGMVGAPIAGATTTSTPTPTVFYLAVGASTSVGVQPTTANPMGQRTDHGYANDLVRLESAKGVTLDLTQIGCPSDTIAKAMFGDSCYTRPATQLSTAVNFLHGHANDVVLVTIDLGFNDISPCLSHMIVDQACVNDNLPGIKDQLTQLITTLKAAAGAHVTFVGINHYDPYIADSIRGGQGQLFAHASIDVLRSLNIALGAVYDSFSIPVANVAQQFHILDREDVKIPSAQRARSYVAQTCELTWMCRGSKYAPNIHPTDAGYQAFARAIDVVLPTTW